MRIVDCLPERSAVFPGGKFDLERWRHYAERVMPGLAALCEEDIKQYDFETDVLPVLTAFLENRERAEQIHAVFEKVTKELPERIMSVFGEDLNVAVVLYLGLCNGAGWATRLHGAPVVLLGIEKILELDWGDERNMIGLIYHELGHIWHFETRGGIPKLDEPRLKSLWQLYSEGMAMYAEQLLCGDRSFYHQNTDGWLEWCRENRKMLCSEYLRRTDEGVSVQDFFGDWNEFMGYSDCGYFLGCELIHSLEEQYGLPELARLDLETIYQALVSAQI